MRLSRDDDKAGESMSIEHQRIMLRNYVAENGGVVIDEYVDDGWSGTNFDRPAVKRMLEDAQSGRIDTIVVKDLSRFGRNYIQVGQYIDYIFPAYGIRFIALNDNLDTSDRTSTAMDMMPIMNVFNEWHAANTSKKIRAVLEAKQRSGQYTNWNYSYGYRAGSDENRTAVIDEVAAQVVRRIFDMRLQGNSIKVIARTLTDEGIPNPATYFTRLDGGKWDRRCSPYWCPRTVMWILSNPIYIGTVTQHKTTCVSYKNHKVIKVPDSEQIVKENAHDAIISQEVWNKVQEINQSVSRGRVDKSNVIHNLSGLLVCADCGKKLKFKTVKNCRYYTCRTYVDLGKKYCSSHTITESVIERIVLADIQSMLNYVELDETKAKERFLRERAKHNAQDKYSSEKQLRAYKNRLEELDKLIQSAFEAKVLKSMPENVCISLCEKYQAEKETLQKQIAELEKKLAELGKDEEGVEEYIKRLKHYGRCETLTREMCLQLIEFISVGEWKENVKEREIHIYYKFISSVNITDFKQNRLKVVP
ncbi:MAG: recombinase family protein [Clostridiales bacterium]|nr:recombinase family protein [Clostridiales bacterium]